MTEIKQIAMSWTFISKTDNLADKIQFLPFSAGLNNNSAFSIYVQISVGHYRLEFAHISKKPNKICQWFKVLLIIQHDSYW